MGFHTMMHLQCMPCALLRHDLSQLQPLVLTQSLALHVGSFLGSKALHCCVHMLRADQNLQHAMCRKLEISLPMLHWPTVCLKAEVSLWIARWG